MQFCYFLSFLSSYVTLVNDPDTSKEEKKETEEKTESLVWLVRDNIHAFLCTCPQNKNC